MHSIEINNCIWAHESDYRDSPAEKLEKFGLVRTTNVPLQQGFHSDSEACLSIAIDDLTAFFTSEQRIVGTMSFPNSTAMGTPFRCMPAINDVQMNIMVETPLFENTFELMKWDFHNCFVESLPFRFKSFEFFDGDVSIISDSQFDYFTNHLTEISVDEVFLSIPHDFQFFSGIHGLKHGSSFHDFLTFYPNMFAEISLIKDFAVYIDNTDSEMLGIDIDSKNILTLSDFLFSGKKGDYLKVFGQTKSLTSPSVYKKTCESLIIPILFYSNSNPLFRIKTQINEKIGFCVKSLAITRNIKLHGQTVDFICLAFPSIAYERTANLNIERGVCLAC